MQAAKPRSRISELCCSVWPTNTGLPEKCGAFSPDRTAPAQLVVGLLVHRHVGKVIGMCENELVGLVIVAAAFQQLPVVVGDIPKSGADRSTSPGWQFRRNSPNSEGPARCRGPRASFPRDCRESKPPDTSRGVRAAGRARRGCRAPDRPDHPEKQVDRSIAVRWRPELRRARGAAVNVANCDQPRNIKWHASRAKMWVVCQIRRPLVWSRR